MRVVALLLGDEGGVEFLRLEEFAAERVEGFGREGGVFGWGLEVLYGSQHVMLLS